ncbi:MAG: 50S ribosomal protein L18 [Actinomycetota bacterium]
MRTKEERKDSGLKRKLRAKHKVQKKSDRLRLCVYRSNKHIYGQIIDNLSGNALVGVSSQVIEKKPEDKGKKDISFRTGEKIAQLAKKKKIEEVVFDKNKFKYHGRVKAFADGARKGGLKF